MRKPIATALVMTMLLLAVGMSVSAEPRYTTASVEPAARTLQSCDPQPLVEAEEAFFTDVSAETGIQDENFDPVNPLPANDHSRVAVVDIDGDGWDDLIMNNMTNLDVKPYEHLIFRNEGDGTFANFSDESGLRNVQSGLLAFGDVDNDGDDDCFAGADNDPDGSRGLTHQLLLNDGQGHFTVRANSGLEGVAGTPKFCGNAIFDDYNRDGKLDLFLGNGATSIELANQLFFGNGDGTFTEVSERLEPAHPRRHDGAVACDYDNDGDQDIFVSVYGVSLEFGHNVLYRNDGEGNFTNAARQTGFEAMATGNYWLQQTGYGHDAENTGPPNRYPVPQERWVSGNGFGLQCEDINNDGYLDVYQANISHPETGEYSRKWSDPTVLLYNQGPEAGFTFKNMYLELNIPFVEGDLLAGVADYDNDSRPDLSMSRESRYDPGRAWPSDEQNGWFGLYHQLWNGTFWSVGLKSGINDMSDSTLQARGRGSGGHAWLDYDHDGDLDVLVGGLQRTSAGRPNYLLRNDLGHLNAWLAVRVEADAAPFNRDAIGTRIELLFPDRRLTRIVKSAGGMYSSSDTRVAHFGMADLGCATELRVTWPNGEVTSLDGRAVGQNRYLTVEYGASTEPTASPTSTPVVLPSATPRPTMGPVAARLFLPAAYSAFSLR